VELWSNRFYPLDAAAIVIFEYDYDNWPIGPAFEAFETLGSERVALGTRHEANHDHLAHPVQRRGRVFAREVLGMCYTCRASPSS